MKPLIILCALFLSIFNVTAQVNIGANTVPNTNAVLELTSGGNKGLLLPRVNLISTTNPSPLTVHVAGMLIYNLTSAGSGDSVVVPGMYLDNGTAWQLIFASASNAIIDSLSCNSGNTALGTYQAGLPCTNTNTKDVSLAVTTSGAYKMSTDTLNGVSFAASGSFVNTGVATVLLTATGTPLLPGTFTYTVNYATYSCSFDITYTSAANFNCTGYTLVQNPTGMLVPGIYTGSYSIPYTSGNGSIYASISQTIDGLTLTRQAGTYAVGGGTVVYNLSGTYTNPNNGNVSFTIPECTTAVFGSPDAIRDAMAASNGFSLAAYDTTSVNNWVQVSPAEYNSVIALVGGAQKCGSTDSIMNFYIAATPFSAPATYLTASVCTATCAPVPGSSYIIGASYILAANPGGGSQVPIGAKIELGETDSLNFDYTVNNALPTPPAFAARRMYYICKRPTGASPATNRTQLGFYGGTNDNSFIAAAPIGGGANSFHFITLEGGYTTLFNSIDNKQLLLQAISTTNKNW